MRNLTKSLIAAAALLAGVADTASAQIIDPNQKGDTIVVDRVVAVVGNKPILESAIENQYAQARVRNIPTTKCKVYEQMLYQKLLVAQADLDSIQVTDKEIESEIQDRLQQFINQMGGIDKMEENFNKPLAEIKADLRDITEDELLAAGERREITKDIKVSPSEVHKFYKSISKDSLPLIDLQIEMCQIVLYPEISQKDIDEVKKRLLGFRDEVLHQGALFETKAILYSEDPGSATSGGELGYMSRNELMPEFSAAAFALKKDSISDIIKTDYGYHLIQMIDRKGERINVRHILMKPRFTIEAKQKAKQTADSLYQVLKEGKLTFEDAARLYSQDEKTNKNGGLMINRHTADTKFTVETILMQDYYNIKNLKPGEFSRPFETLDDLGSSVYKIMMVKSKEAPHQASLETDYQIIQDMALNKKYEDAIEKWKVEKSKSTYIRIAPDYKKCPFEYDGWLHNDIVR
ncbi:MAG: peptidylprolyl isomerase [Bacteroidales bacterium]|nr:peptidylprolyl isomerase [Bacteroidales bacterium]